MVNKSTIQALYDAGYTDRELVESFPNLTYKIVRSLLKTPPALSQGARNEIHENHKDTDEKYISSIAKEYRTSPSLVRTAITEPPGRILVIPKGFTEASEILTTEELMELYDVSERIIVHWLANAPRKTKYLTPADIEHIQARLALGHSQADIAASYGITPARVSQLNPNKKKQKERTVDVPWAKLLEEYDQGKTVASLTIKYNISRSAIYAKIRTKQRS